MSIVRMSFASPRAVHITHRGTCDQGYEYSIGNLGSIGWNDKIASVVTYQGCAHAFYYDYTGFVGARLDCPPAGPDGHDNGYYNLGALDDRASSVRWTNSPLLAPTPAPAAGRPSPRRVGVRSATGGAGDGARPPV